MKTSTAKLSDWQYPAIVEDWTDTDTTKGQRFTTQYIRNLGLRDPDDLTTVYISTDALPGLKIIANSPKGSKHEAIIVILADRSEMVLIRTEE